LFAGYLQPPAKSVLDFSGQLIHPLQEGAYSDYWVRKGREKKKSSKNQHELKKARLIAVALFFLGLVWLAFTQILCSFIIKRRQTETSVSALKALEHCDHPYPVLEHQYIKPTPREKKIGDWE
jgi:hypothetical protein